MSVLNNHSYHGTISIYAKVFGSIFNNIKIIRASNNSVIQVPITYVSGQKYNATRQQNTDPNSVRYKQRIPMMTYELVSWQRDPSRSKNKFHQITNFDPNDPEANGLLGQYNRIPYNFNFRLDARTDYLDDMLQIIEQISTTFDPNISIKVKDNLDIGGESAISVVLTDASLEDSFEGLFETSRNIDCSFNFILEGYLYRPTGNRKLIDTVNIEYKDYDTQELIETQVITP